VFCGRVRPLASSGGAVTPASACDAADTVMPPYPGAERERWFVFEDWPGK